MHFKTIVYAFLSCLIAAQSIFYAALPRFVLAEELPIPMQIEEVLDEEIIEPYVLISAVQITGGTGKTQEDFIELFNPTDEPFDLNGHRIVKRTASGTSDTLIKNWTTSTIVPPHHFYLWANSGFTSITQIPDTTSGGTLADNNGIALREGENDAGEIIDSLSWGSTANGFLSSGLGNPSANESITCGDVFDIACVFNVQPSNPRNSAIALEPDSEPPSDDDEPPVDDPSPTEDDLTPDDDPSEPEDETLADIVITELLPNPSGEDSGFEKIELYNAGSQAVNLEYYILDDIASDQALSTNAYVLPNITLAARGYIAITIPVGKFSLNNSGGDVVSLFNSSYELINTAYYEGISPENESYSLFNGNEWYWAPLTFGKANGEPPAKEEDEEHGEKDEESKEDESEYNNSGLIINEIFPQPISGITEFVEIYNAGSEVARLHYVNLYIGDRKKQLPEQDLQPGEYYVIEQASLPIQLRNSGQMVKLLEDDTILSTVTYPLAIENASFAKFEDGYLWTTHVTKKTVNELQIPETVKKEVSATADKTAVKKNSTASAKVSTKTIPTVATKTTSKTDSTKPITDTIKTEEQSVGQEMQSEGDTKKQKESLGKIIAMGAAAVAAGVAALYKLVFSIGAE